nr:phosphopantetheine-binding protein [Streptomyces boncukensis]
MIAGVLDDDTGTDTDASADIGADIGMDTTLGDDLEMESIDLVALSARLEEWYGPRVNLAEYLAGLELDEIIELTVGRIVAHVRSALAEGS